MIFHLKFTIFARLFILIIFVTGIDGNSGSSSSNKGTSCDITDLTKNLSDAEIEMALSDLSLSDLSILSKFMDSKNSVTALNEDDSFSPSIFLPYQDFDEKNDKERKYKGKESFFNARNDGKMLFFDVNKDKRPQQMIDLNREDHELMEDMKSFDNISPIWKNNELDKRLDDLLNKENNDVIDEYKMNQKLDAANSLTGLDDLAPDVVDSSENLFDNIAVDDTDKGAYYDDEDEKSPAYREQRHVPPYSLPQAEEEEMEDEEEEDEDNWELEHYENNANARAKREDTQNQETNTVDEEYLKLLENSFPRDLEENELEISDDKNRDHVRVKRRQKLKRRRRQMQAKQKHQAKRKAGRSTKPSPSSHLQSPPIKPNLNQSIGHSIYQNMKTMLNQNLKNLTLGQNLKPAELNQSVKSSMPLNASPQLKLQQPTTLQQNKPQPLWLNSKPKQLQQNKPQPLWVHSKPQQLQQNAKPQPVQQNTVSPPLQPNLKPPSPLQQNQKPLQQNLKPQPLQPDLKPPAPIQQNLKPPVPIQPNLKPQSPSPIQQQLKLTPPIIKPPLKETPKQPLNQQLMPYT